MAVVCRSSCNDKWFKRALIPFQCNNMTLDKFRFIVVSHTQFKIQCLCMSSTSDSTTARQDEMKHLKSLQFQYFIAVAARITSFRRKHNSLSSLESYTEPKQNINQNIKFNWTITISTLCMPYHEIRIFRGKSAGYNLLLNKRKRQIPVLFVQANGGAGDA